MGMKKDSLGASKKKGQELRNKSFTPSLVVSKAKSALKFWDKPQKSKAEKSWDEPQKSKATTTTHGGLPEIQELGEADNTRVLWGCPLYFIMMSCGFAINHGCVTSVLALTAAEFDQRLATASSAMLYGTYALSALMISVPLVKIFGAKKVLAGAAGSYCFYVTSFGLIAVFGTMLDLRIQFAICLTGSAIGGIGAGSLWTAQGTYYGKASRLHASATGQDVEDVNLTLGGIFSTIYVGGEVLMKMLATVVQDEKVGWGKKFVFGFYAGASLLSALSLCFIKPMPDELTQEEKDVPVYKLATKKLRDIYTVASDRKVWLIGPLQIAFGWGTAWVNAYLFGTLAKISLGSSNIGMLAAIPAAYAAIVGVPYTAMAKKLGNNFFLNMSAFCYMSIGLCGLLIPNKMVELGWPAFIGLMVLLGNVRAVLESINKAVYADFFPDAQAGAFAMNIIYSGLSSLAGFLAFTFGIDHDIAAVILVILCAFSFLTTPMAFHDYNRKKEK